jgi:hypothetical protein
MIRERACAVCRIPPTVPARLVLWAGHSEKRSRVVPTNARAI